MKYVKFFGRVITKSESVTPQGVTDYLPTHLCIRSADFALWLHHACLKGSLQVLVPSESSGRWHRRNRESWWTKAYYESSSQGMSLFHYFPFTWRKSQRPYHGLEDSLKLLRAPPPAHWPQLLFTLFPHWLLAFPCKHPALTSGPLYLLIICQEKSDSSIAHPARYFGLCSNVTIREPSWPCERAAPPPHH